MEPKSLIGDGRATTLYSKHIGQQHAQDIARLLWEMYEGTEMEFVYQPNIVCDGRETIRMKGFAYSTGKKAGLIVIHGNGGQSWGTLAHELAHLCRKAQHCDHNWNYKEAHCKLLDDCEYFAARSTIDY